MQKKYHHIVIELRNLKPTRGNGDGRKLPVSPPLQKVTATWLEPSHPLKNSTNGKPLSEFVFIGDWKNPSPLGLNK